MGKRGFIGSESDIFLSHDVYLCEIVNACTPRVRLHSGSIHSAAHWRTPLSAVEGCFMRVMLLSGELSILILPTRT